jgi:hypothetical protein
LASIIRYTITYTKSVHCGWNSIASAIHLFAL